MRTKDTTGQRSIENDRLQWRETYYYCCKQSRNFTPGGSKASITYYGTISSFLTALPAAGCYTAYSSIIAAVQCAGCWLLLETRNEKIVNSKYRKLEYRKLERPFLIFTFLWSLHPTFLQYLLCFSTEPTVTAVGLTIVNPLFSDGDLALFRIMSNFTCTKLKYRWWGFFTNVAIEKDSRSRIDYFGYNASILNEEREISTSDTGGYLKNTSCSIKNFDLPYSKWHFLIIHNFEIVTSIAQ